MVKKKLIEKTLSEPATSVGSTLSNLWNASFGHWSSYLSEKQKIKYSYKIEEFKHSFGEKFNKIPTSHLIEPKLNIVGPAFEATKYHLEEDSIREMFENLLISSVDDRKSNKVLPSFVQIITEMSPLDAHLLSEIYNAEKNTIPIIDLFYKNDSGEIVLLYQNVIEKNISCEYTDLEISLINLQRIGLIEVNPSLTLIDEDKYNYIYNHEIYLNINKKIKPAIQMRKGIAIISSYGLSFSNICLDQNL